MNVSKLVFDFTITSGAFTAKKCEPSGPDLGTSSGASVEWSGDIIIQVSSSLHSKRFKNILFSEFSLKPVLKTSVKYTCPLGQAFDGLYTREEWGNCTGSSANVYWKYNSSSPLPDCIGIHHVFLQN